MRLYTESSEETLRAHRLVKQWNDDGLLSKEQYTRLEQDTVTDLRTTNIFLRIVLFFFTLVVVAAVICLFFVTASPRPSGPVGVLLLVFAVVSYIAAERAVAQARLYRYGIEEALAVCSVGLLCLGLGSVLSAGDVPWQGVVCLIGAIGACSALWVWYRFGLWYAFPAAMVFSIFLPAYATSSHTTQRVLLCVLYAAALACIAVIRSRHRFDYLEPRYSLAEAFLWLGIYLPLNLKLTGISSPAQLWSSSTLQASEFSTLFYWTTWVLLWCLSVLILVRGVRQKNRFVLAVGMIVTVLTLITNKPYLGWQRHTWDPMLLGIALAAVAVFLGRWLAKGPGGVRNGFTIASMSAKDKHAMSVASSAFGLVSPQSITPAPQPKNSEFESGFGGGSGGGGASGNF